MIDVTVFSSILTFLTMITRRLRGFLDDQLVRSNR